MKILLIPLLLVGVMANAAQVDDQVEGLTTPGQARELSGKQMELQRERGNEAADQFGEQVEDELRDAPAIDPDARSMDIDPVPPLISPDSPQMAPSPSAVPAPRLPGESERITPVPSRGN
nr:hypothetical protein [uncultured Pseudomonas sp.]